MKKKKINMFKLASYNFPEKVTLQAFESKLNHQFMDVEAGHTSC